VRRGEARRGEARRGEARRGEARRGEARRGEARSGQVRSGQVRSGQVRSGQVRSGLKKLYMKTPSTDLLKLTCHALASANWVELVTVIFFFNFLIRPKQDFARFRVLGMEHKCF
jgi:hypothetical protein